MKRSLIYLFVAIAVAGVLGTLIARDPGYVLVSYGDMSIQTGLWVMLAILVVVAIAVYYVLRLFRVVGQSVSGFRAWRENRSRARTSQLTSRGLMYFQEGDYERAERFLESGARDNPNAAASFIYAARAANAQGKDEVRENYLRQARESDPEAAQAVAVADAAMAIERQQFGAALRALDDARSSDEVTRLKAEALL
ncbi:MAG TPA: heme biosynthesis HemY N-terminal domain-containing protein, partial [Pseudomonadales bacterium]|nr:heme biosynthesis HemY N-terminal domain-containing protein [Pseudomonadales bacterium]